MKSIEFGKLIEKLIHFSGQKNYSLAVELGYDVSYISKWINSTMLPTSKNIKNICKATANFTVNFSNESSINDLLSYFEIDEDKNEDYINILKQKIESELYKSYLFSSNRISNKKNKKFESNLNSVLQVNPIFRKRYLDNLVKQFSLESKKSNMIILCDLFFLNEGEKLFLAGIRSGVKEEYQNQVMDINFLMNFDNYKSENIILDVMLFLNMVTNTSNIRYKVYSCGFPSNSLILVYKDKFVHTAIYNKSKCLFTTISTDKDVVAEMYDSLDDMMVNQSRIIFKEVSSKDMLLDQDYMSYIMGLDLRWIIGNMCELFMPSDLFLEIGERLFGNSSIEIARLRKIDALLQKATYNSNLEVIIFESALRKYISTGELKFFNVSITLSMEQREKHISYLNKIIREKNNIKIKFIEGALIEEFKNKENPSIYLSKGKTLLKIEQDQENNGYLIVKDKGVEDLFYKFFDKIWNEKKDVILDDRDKIINIIDNILIYIQILNMNYGENK